MISYKILNEGELYCTNLNFNLDDENFQKLIGDPGQKDEDAVKSLNTKIKLLQDSFISKIQDICSRRKFNKQDFSKAIYFTAYYNNKNADCYNYSSKYFIRGSRRYMD